MTKATFEQGLLLYNMNSFREAAQLFQDYLEIIPEDRAAQIYLKRCQQQAIAVLAD